MLPSVSWSCKWYLLYVIYHQPNIWRRVQIIDWQGRISSEARKEWFERLKGVIAQRSPFPFVRSPFQVTEVRVDRGKALASRVVFHPGLYNVTSSSSFIPSPPKGGNSVSEIHFMESLCSRTLFGLSLLPSSSPRSLYILPKQGSSASGSEEKRNKARCVGDVLPRKMIIRDDGGSTHL